MNIREHITWKNTLIASCIAGSLVVGHNTKRNFETQHEATTRFPMSDTAKTLYDKGILTQSDKTDVDITISGIPIGSPYFQMIIDIQQQEKQRLATVEAEQERLLDTSGIIFPIPQG